MYVILFSIHSFFPSHYGQNILVQFIDAELSLWFVLGMIVLVELSERETTNVLSFGVPICHESETEQGLDFGLLNPNSNIQCSLIAETLYLLSGLSWVMWKQEIDQRRDLTIKTVKDRIKSVCAKVDTWLIFHLCFPSLWYKNHAQDGDLTC